MTRCTRARPYPFRRFAALFAAAFLASGSGGAWAQSSQSGTVLRLHVRGSDGLVYFYVSGLRSAPPACATQPYWVIPNEASTAARQQLALLMMAEATGKSVIVYGTGACSRWPDGESVLEVAVSD